MAAVWLIGTIPLRPLANLGAMAAFGSNRVPIPPRVFSHFLLGLRELVPASKKQSERVT